MTRREQWPAREAGAADATDAESFVDLAEIGEIELRILARMREFTIGEHASLFHGAGFDFVGLRGWQAGDRFEAIDWPQSSLTNFSPLVVREFEQRSTSSVMIVADASASTRCGLDGVRIAQTIARALATIGLSAVFFQDAVGLLTFDAGFARVSGLRPRVGRTQVLHCLDAYQAGRGLEEVRHGDSLSATLGGFLRKTSLVPVISDFLFDDVESTIRELARLGAGRVHDVFLAIVDAGFAFDLPAASAGWIEAFDVETGRSRVMSRAEFGRLASRVRAWQDDVARMARDADLDVLRLGVDRTQFELALMEFVVERRLRRKSS